MNMVETCSCMNTFYKTVFDGYLSTPYFIVQHKKCINLKFFVYTVPFARIKVTA